MTIISLCLYRALCKLVEDKPNTWDHYLDAVMFGLRTKAHLTTRFSPFFLMFGMEATHAKWQRISRYGMMGLTYVR